MSKLKFLATTALGLLAISTPAFAQTSDNPTATLGEVVVTGSRLKTGFTTATPVTVMSVQQIQAMAPNSAGEALAKLPAFLGSQITSNLGAATSVTGGAQALLNLRNLGAGRTLVLLNGERLPATNVNGTVDTNVVPQALLQRVDVVTGGASAGYGSDAVAGVVNFVIDNRFNGVQLNVSAGETRYGDARNAHATLAAGRSFLGGRLHVEGSLESFNQTGIGLGTNGRKWYDQSAGFVTLPTGSATTFGIIPDVRYSTMAPGGLVSKVTNTAGKTVTVAGLSGMQFDANGALIPFDTGLYSGSSFQSGGSGPRAVNGMSPEQNRQGVFFRADYDLNDTTTVFGEVMYNRSFSDAISVYPYEPTTKGFTIYSDNAYLSPTLKNLMTANNVASFTIGRLSQDLPPLENRSTTILQRVDFGIKGQLGPKWSYDADIALAQADQNFGEYMTINRNLYAAADAVLSNGQIVCRSTLSGLDPNCVPINVMGTNAISKQGAAYVSAWDWGHTFDKQSSLSANVRGDLGDKFQLGAGPISVATGFAWRNDQAYRTVTPLSNSFTNCTGLRATGCAAYNGLYGGFQTYNPGPLSARISVAEGYVEFGVPVLKDLPFVRALDVDVAGRATDYSTSGMTYTWKIGPSWRVTDEFRIRATRSQDIRAPNFNELFSTVAGTGSVTSVLYPSSAAPGPLQTTTVTVTTGNLNLKPEVAQTLTVGGVYRPDWLKGLQGSIDYYSMDVSQAIFTIPTQAIVDNCAAGNQTYCQLITVGGAAVTSTAALNGATGISVRAAPTNVGSIKASGLDMELAYGKSLWGGRLDTRAVANYALSFSNSSAVAPNGPIYIGSLGLGGGTGTPQWTANFSEDYERPLTPGTSWVLGLEERLISAGKYNANYTTAQLSDAQNRAPQVTYVDLRAALKFSAFGAKDELYFTVNNLFDVAPPALPAASTFQQSTNYDLYDVLGQRFTIGLKARW